MKTIKHNSKVTSSLSSNFSRRTFRLNNFIKNFINKEFWKDSVLFILLSAFNGLIPVLICLIAASLNPFGTQLTMSIGYITAIQLGFVQLSWTISVACLFVHNKSKQNSNIDYKYDEQNMIGSIFSLSWIYGLISVPLFIGISYAYNTYASAHINTLMGQTQAYNYIYGLSVYLLFIPTINSSIVLIHKYKSKWLSYLFLLLFVGISVSLSAVFTICTYKNFVTDVPNSIPIINGSYQGLLLAMGFSITSLIFVGILIPLTSKLLSISFRQMFDLSAVKLFLSKTWSPLLVIASIQIIKMFMLIGIGLSLTDSVAQVVPVSYQLARDVWYNLLYLLPFLGYGLADAILYHGIGTNIKESNAILIQSTVAFLVFEIPFLIGIYYSIQPLSEYYLTNNLYNKMPVAMDTSKVKLTYVFQTLLKKAEYRDKIAALTAGGQVGLTNALKPILTQIMGPNGGAIAPVIAKQLFPLLNGLLDSNPTVQNNSINSIVGMIQKFKLEPQVQTFFANYLNNGKATSVFKMFDVAQHSNAYIYIAFWVTLYPTAQMINFSLLHMSGKFNNIVRTIINIFIQIVLMVFVVAFGIQQQYSTTFPMYDAWSFPFVIFGPISVINYAIFYALANKKIKKMIKK